MAKAAYIPKHYSATLTAEEMFDLIMTLRVCIAQLHGTDGVEELLAVFEEAYAGDLPGAVGEPLTEEGGEAVAA
jgi:hypothetical protein